MSRDVIKYGPATLAALERELNEPVLFDAAALLAATAWRETLAANLATAGALELAYLAGEFSGRWQFDQLSLGPEPWSANASGRPMPGWGGGE